MSAPVAEAQVKLTLVDRVTAGIKRIQARFAALSRSLGIDRIARATRDLGRAFRGLGDGLSKSIGRLSRFTALIGLGAGGALAGILNVTRSTAELGASINDVATRLGVGVEGLQEFRYAAEMSGMASSNFDVALRRFIRRSSEAARGTGAAKDAFKELGIGLKDANGRLKDSDRLLMEVADAIAKVPNQADRLRLAFKFFDTDGAAMVSMLAKGSDGLRELREEARKTGHVLGQDVADFSSQYLDNLLRVRMRLQGLRNFLGVQFLPVINDLVVKVREWIDANRDLIRGKIAEWAKAVSTVIRDLVNPASELRERISELTAGFTKWVDRIKPVVDFLGGPLNATLIAIAAYILGPLVVALTVLGAAFVKLGFVILTTPIGWLMAGLAAIGAAAYVLVQRWDDFLGYWTGLWGRVTSAFEDGFLNGMLALWKEFNPVVHVARGIDAVIEYFTGVSLLDTGSAFMQGLFDGIASVASQGASWIGGYVDEWTRALSFKADVWASWGRHFINQFWEGLKAGWGQVAQWFADKISELTGWLPDWLKNRMGFTVDVAPTAAKAGASVSSVGRPPDIPPPFSPGAMTAGRGDVEANTVQAGAVQAQTLNVPEPLLVHKPQSIDASVHIASLTVQGGNGTPAEIQAAVRSALAGHAAEQRASIQSGLTD